MMVKPSKSTTAWANTTHVTHIGKPIQILAACILYTCVMKSCLYTCAQRVTFAHCCFRSAHLRVIYHVAVFALLMWFTSPRLWQCMLLMPIRLSISPSLQVCYIMLDMFISNAVLHDVSSTYDVAHCHRMSTDITCFYA